MFTESPGIAPIRIPAPVPKIRPARLPIVNTLPSAVKMSDLLLSPYLINIGAGRVMFSNIPNRT